MSVVDPSANNVVDPSANNIEETPLASRASVVDLPDRLWTYDDFRAVEAMPVDFGTRLASLAFIRAAIRRSARFCCAAALAGLLIGVGAYVAFPPAYKASTSVLLTYGPYENVNTAPADDQAIAQSRRVAEAAMHKLGLMQSVGSFLAAYTATPVSNRVLLITVSAPSANAAVSRANAVAAAFLKLRAGELEAAQNIVLGSLDQQLTQASQQVHSLGTQITRLSAQPPSPGKRAGLAHLRAERSQAASAVSRLQQAVAGNPASTATSLAVKGSVVLDPAAPLAHSRLKYPLFYTTIGLVLGLALSVGIVIIRALASDRLRRRDDIAAALDAPVKLSVGKVRLSRWPPSRHGLAPARSAEIRQIVAHLASAAPPRSRGVAALAVIPVDDPRVAAISLVSLAWGWAQLDMRVVVADLCRGSPAGRLLGVSEPGVHTVTLDEVDLIVAIPEPDDVVPVRGLHGASPAQSPLDEAFESADLVFTLAALDPSLGGEHLITWATEAVVFATSGVSSATRIHAVGEMIRLAGMTLDSAVLVGADRTDESLGAAPSPGAAPTPSAEFQPADSGRPSP